MLKFRNPARGYVMILVAFLIPIVLTAVNYTTKRVAQSHKSTVKKSAVYAVAQAVLEKYNPAKTFDDQYLMLHTAAAVALNDRAFDLKKDMHTAPLTTVTLYAASATTVASASLARMYRTLSSASLKNNSGIISKDEDYGSLLCDEEPLTDVVFDPSNAQISYKMINTDNGTFVRNVVCYDPDEDDSTEEKPALAMDTVNNLIECEVLDKKVSANPAKCDVDIVLTLPTNHAACATDVAAPVASIVRVAKAYAKFLKENFLHTRGTAVALVPYSAKISAPPDKSSWTVAIPPMNQLPNKPYLKQAIAYGTDGQGEGGEIVSNSTQYDWGDADGADSDAVANPNVGFPIMFRRGSEETYRGTRFYKGVLLSTANPNSDSLKFQRMNPNPCYLGHCNLLAGCCETNCPTYMANPYFITELTDNIPDVIHDLGLIRPINDPKNKSNFLFLAVHWAQMLLFETWTNHPNAAAVTNQKFLHPARAGKKKAIIFVVNGPDRFEPNELTYLGFNNDASEVPMVESDTINSNYNYGAPTNDARTSPVKSTKGTLVYSGTGTYKTTSDGHVTTSGTGKLTFPKKGMLMIVLASGKSPGSCTFTNINNVSQSSVAVNTAYSVIGTRTFYLTPEQISNATDNNRNHHVDFSFSDIRIVSVAPLTVQMYEGSEQRTQADCATSDAGNTNKNITFRLNDRVPFTVQAKVPCAWPGDSTDFRQTSGTATIYSNDNTHPFRINVTVPSSSTEIVGVSPGNTLGETADDASVVVTSRRKLSSFTLKGNYNYVPQETWQKSYISKINYTRSLTALTVTSDSPLNDDTDSEDKNETEDSSSVVHDDDASSWEENKTGDNNSVEINATYSCSEKVSDECGCCHDEHKSCTCNPVTTGGGWTYASHSSAWDGCSCAADGTKVNRCVCTFNYTRPSACYSLFDINGNEVDGGTCNSWDEKTESGSPETATDSCTKNYDNKRETPDACGSGYSHNSALDAAPYTGAYSQSVEDLNQNSWGGSFDGYTYTVINVNANVENLTLDSKTQLYSNGSFADASTDCGTTDATVTTGNLTPTTTDGDHYKYTSTATNCQLSGLTRVTADGYVGITPVSGQQSATATTTVTIDPEHYVYNLVDNNQYEVTVSCTNVVLSNPLMVEGNYSDDSDVSGVPLVSAEITNRPVETVISTVQMYEGSEQRTQADCATSDAGNTNKNIMFRLNTKVPFTVKAKVPYAWMGNPIDFRQTSGTATIYSNDSTHSFKVTATVLPAFNAVISGSTDFSAISGNLIVYANRNDVDFTVTGTLSKFWEATYSYESTSGTAVSGSGSNFTGDKNLTIECDGFTYRKLRLTLANATIATKKLTYQKMNWKYFGDGNSCATDTDKTDEGVRIDGTSGAVWDTGDGAIETGRHVRVRFPPMNGEIRIWGHVYRTYRCASGNTHKWEFKLWLYPFEENTWHLLRKDDVYGCQRSNESRTWEGRKNVGNNEFCLNFGDCADHSTNRTYPRDLEVESWTDNDRVDYSNGHISFNGRGKLNLVIRSAQVGANMQGKIATVTKNPTTSDQSISATITKGGGVLQSGGTYNGWYKYTIPVQNVKSCQLSFASQTTGSFNGSSINAGTSQEFTLTAGTADGNYYKYTSTAVNCQLSGLTRRTTTTGRVGNTPITGQQSATATTTVTIDPEYYPYTPTGDGGFTVTIPCQNVVLTNPEIAAGYSPVTRYIHPNLLTDGVKNVRIVDFGHSDSNKPRVHGNIVFGSDVNGNLSGKACENLEHLKYWTTSGNNNNFYRPDGITGDFFVQLLDFDGNIPAVEWFLSSSGSYGTYENNYSFSGLHRVFFPDGEQVYDATSGAQVNLISTGDDQKMAFVFGGFTCPINNVLMLNGYQTGAGTNEIAPSMSAENLPDAAVAKVTAEACAKLAEAAAVKEDTMVYVIKYGTNADALDRCVPEGKIKTYSASSETDLNEALHEIAENIKSFADYSAAWTEEIVP